MVKMVLVVHMVIIKNIFYAGTEFEWNEIDKGTYTEIVTNALHYYSETEPTEAGNFWHYVDGVPTVW